MTVLDDEYRHYISGIKDVGGLLTFEFLYETSVFNTLRSAEGASHTWAVDFPDGLSISWTGVPSVIMSGHGVNEALTFQLAVSIMTDFTVTPGTVSSGNGTTGVTGATG